MSNNLEKKFSFNPSPTNKNVYIIYECVGKKRNLDILLPVGHFPITSGYKPEIVFEKYPILSKKELAFIKAKAKSLLLETNR